MTEKEIKEIAKYLTRKHHNISSPEFLPSIQGFGLGFNEDSNKNVLIIYVDNKENIKTINERIKDIDVEKFYRIIGNTVLDESDTDKKILEKLKQYLNLIQGD